ncbi:MAG: hypothetical protein WCD21_24245 [Streptomyces sp.]
MHEPCRGCALRTVDLGGWRCQAYALTGDGSRTGPACHRSPDHGAVRALVDGAGGRAGDFAYRASPKT